MYCKVATNTWLKLKLNKQPMGCDAQLAGQHISKMTYEPSKLGQTDLVFCLWSEFTSGLRLQYCKSLRIAVMIWEILYKRVPYSQRYLFNANPDTNHNANTSNPDSNSRPKRSNPNPTNPQALRGATTAEKLRGTEVWVPPPERLRSAPGQRPGCVLGAVREGVPLPLWESGSITPGKFVKIRMLNPAFWWLLCLLVGSLAVKVFGFWKITAMKLGDQYIVGPPT